MRAWRVQPFAFKYQLGDLTLFRISLPVQMRSVPLAEKTGPVNSNGLPVDAPANGAEGYCIRALPLTGDWPQIGRLGAHLCYVSARYRHCFIDLRQSFDDYERKFSAKTRSTIRRKVRKYAEHCGGTIAWKTYRTPDEMQDFHRLAREVSARTYQERLLDAGLPDAPAFVAELRALAAQDRARGYILFDGDRPVSYLYCPVDDSVLVYSHLGYDPDYNKLSVGTVLQWLAVEQLFGEARFCFFDFDEGESEHKRLFATHDVPCANVLLLKPSLRNRLLVRSHWVMDRVSERLGMTLDRLGLKARVKRLLRSAR